MGAAVSVVSISIALSSSFLACDSFSDGVVAVIVNAAAAAAGGVASDPSMTSLLKFRLTAAGNARYSAATNSRYGWTKSAGSVL